MASSTTVLVLSFLAVGLTLVGYQAVFTYLYEVTPRSLEIYPDENATIRVMPDWGDASGRSIDVLLTQPLEGNPPPPPGTEAWPEPGHFVMSEDLADDIEILSARWGIFDGYIAAEYLPSSNPRKIIARPTSDLGAIWDASGFKVDPVDAVFAQEILGFSRGKIPLGAAIAGVTATTVIPALILFMTTIGIAKREHATKARTLELIGYRPIQLGRLFLRSILAPLGIGCVVGAAVSSLFFVTDIPLPFAQLSVRAMDVQRSLSTVVISILLALIVAIGVAVLASWPPSLERTSRARLSAHSGQGWLAAIGIAIILVTSNMAYSETVASLSDDSRDLGAVWLVIGSLLAVAFTPAIVSLAFTVISSISLRIAHRRNSALGVLVARSLTSTRGSTKVATTSAILVVIVGLCATWALSGSLPAVRAQRVIDAIDGKFYSLMGASVGHDNDSKVLDGLPRDVSILTIDRLIAMDTDSEITETVNVYAAAPELAHWGMSTGVTIPEDELLGHLDTEISLGPGTQIAPYASSPPSVKEMRETYTGDGEVAMFLGRNYVAFRQDGERIDGTQLQAAVSSIGGSGWKVSLGGEQWIVGAKELSHDLRWVTWFSALAAALILATIWLRTRDDQSEHAAMIAPVDALFAPHYRGPAVLLIRVLTIASVGTGVGYVIAGLFARMADRDLTLTGGSLPIITVIAGISFVFTILIGIPLVFTVSRRTAEWRPGGSR